MYVNYHTQCCGVKELTSLSAHATPESAIRALGKIFYPLPKVNNRLVQAVEARCRKEHKQLSDPNTMGIQNPPIEPKNCNAVFRDAGQYSRFRFAIFTEAVHPVHLGTFNHVQYGMKFAAFIVKNKLGDVTETGRHINPNSGSSLKCWMWAIDHEAVKQWLVANTEKAFANEEENEWVENLKSGASVPAGVAPQMPMGAPGNGGQQVGNNANIAGYVGGLGQQVLNYPNR